MSQLQKPRTARFPIIEFLLLFSSLLSLSLEVSAFGLFVAFFRKVGDEHRVVKHPLRSLLPTGRKSCLVRSPWASPTRCSTCLVLGR